MNKLMAQLTRFTLLAKSRRAALGLFMLVSMTAIMACVTTNTSNTASIPSTNYNSRVSILVIHHTSANYESSVNILTKPSSRPVSSHYLVPDPSDETYTRKKLEVFELVPETGRAWHAGNSYWAGKSALNDHSIGIEIVNQTYCVKPGAQKAAPTSMQASSNSPRRFCFYPDFPETQMEILIELIQGIQERHPRIDPTHIVGHSDIAPSRKIDPGPRFPWERLYQLGYGAWFDDETAVKHWEQFSTTPMPLVNVQKALHIYGYKIEATGVLDEQTRNVLRAFQMHFRPMEITGEPSLESTAILYALIEKYRPRHLSDLLVIAPR